MNNLSPNATVAFISNIQNLFSKVGENAGAKGNGRVK
jgi:hypothetical protein